MKNGGRNYPQHVLMRMRIADIGILVKPQTSKLKMASRQYRNTSKNQLNKVWKESTLHLNDGSIHHPTKLPNKRLEKILKCVGK